MSGTLKKVRFKRAFKNYRVGDEITPNGTLRDYLVNQQYADIVEDRPAKFTRKAADKVTAPVVVPAPQSTQQPLIPVIA